jgi:hypothetical protein
MIQRRFLVGICCSASVLHAARTQWGAVYTWCRTFLMRIQAYAHGMPLPMRQLFLRWTIALPYLMRSHLSDYRPGSDSIETLLTASEARCASHLVWLHCCSLRGCMCVCVLVWLQAWSAAQVRRCMLQQDSCATFANVSA